MPKIKHDQPQLGLVRIGATSPPVKLALPTGAYIGPGQWVYQWNRELSSVTILYNPSTKAWGQEPVQKQSGQWAAILAELLDQGQLLTYAQLKGMKTGQQPFPKIETHGWQAWVESLQGQWGTCVQAAEQMYVTVTNNPEDYKAGVEAFMQTMAHTRRVLDQSAPKMQYVQNAEKRLELQRQWAEIDLSWLSLWGGFRAGLESGTLPMDLEDAIDLAETTPSTPMAQVNGPPLVAVTIIFVVLGVAITVSAASWAIVNKPYADGFKAKADAWKAATDLWVEQTKLGNDVPTPREVLGEAPEAEKPHPLIGGEGGNPWAWLSIGGFALALTAGAALWFGAGGQELAAAGKARAKRVQARSETDENSLTKSHQK